MAQARSERVAGGTGLLFFVFILGGIIFLGEEPALNAPAPEVSSYFAEHAVSVRLGVLLVSAGLTFFVPFVGALSNVVGDELERNALVRTAFACAVGAVVVIMISFVFFAAAAFRPMEVDAALTRSLYDVSLLLTAPFALLLTGFFAAIAVSILQTRTLPRWLGWFAAAAAVLRVLAAGSIFSDRGPFAADGLLEMLGSLVWFLWTVAASVILLRVQAPSTHRRAAAVG